MKKIAPWRLGLYPLRSLDQEMASLLNQHQDAVKRLAEVPGQKHQGGSPMQPELASKQQRLGVPSPRRRAGIREIRIISNGISRAVGIRLSLAPLRY